jgi:hypothetical protein
MHTYSICKNKKGLLSVRNDYQYLVQVMHQSDSGGSNNTDNKKQNGWCGRLRTCL